MSDPTIEQLEHFKKVMEPTPPFLDALIAEKQAHAKLRAEVERLRDVWESPRVPRGAENDDYTLPYIDGLMAASDRLTRILEADDA